MIVRICAFIPPNRLSFETATNLQRSLAQYQASVDFEGFTGHMAVYTKDPVYPEALRILEDNDAILMDLRGDDMKSFSEYFKDKVPLDYERAEVYCIMCMEGRI